RIPTRPHRITSRRHGRSPNAPRMNSGRCSMPSYLPTAAILETLRRTGADPMFNQLHQPPRFTGPRDDGDTALIEAQAGLLNRAKIIEDAWAEACRQFIARWQPVADQMGREGVNVFLDDL